MDEPTFTQDDLDAARQEGYDDGHGDAEAEHADDYDAGYADGLADARADLRQVIDSITGNGYYDSDVADEVVAAVQTWVKS